MSSMLRRTKKKKRTHTMWRGDQNYVIVKSIFIVVFISITTTTPNILDTHELKHTGANAPSKPNQTEIRFNML